MAIAAPNVLTQQLQTIGWSKILRKLTLQEDIFTVLGENYSVPKKTLPNGIYYTVDSLKDTSHTHRLPMIMPLSGAARYGNVQTQPGFEENLQTQFVTIYKNDYSHAVVNQLFGIDAQDKRFYNLIQQELPLLGTYFKELKGLFIRQALLQRFGENLTLQPPTSTLIANEWTPNFYVKNCPDAQQPAFNANNVTYTNRIGTAMVTAGTGINATCDFQYLSALSHRAAYDNLIDPIMVGGEQKYIVLIPSRQAVFLKNANVGGSYGAIWTQYNRMNKTAMEWPNYLGDFGNLILIEDPRSPTLLLGGTNSPFTLTAGYLYPGRNDQRSTSVNARDVGFLLGKGALIDWEAESLHWETENALTYNKFRGRGGFGTCGVQQTQYDNAGGTNRLQYSSMALVFAREPISN